MPGIMNTRAAPPVKKPDVIVTVNTVPEMAALPAAIPAPPAMKVRVPGPTMASPAPLSVMTILPVEGMLDAGVRDTVMVTPVAPLAALLRVIAGWFVPSVETAVPAMPTASKPADIVASELDESLKPPIVAARAAPSVSPVSVMVIAAVPVAALPVVSTIVVLVAVAAGDEVAVKDTTVLAIKATDPKK